LGISGWLKDYGLKLSEVLRLSSVKAAPMLLGCILSRLTPEGLLSLKIVETEAYHQNDPASHSFRGMTKRTAPMFEAGGTIYVYFTYGMHYCVNIVVGQKGVGEAVLIRAGEPLEGIQIMKKHRGIDEVRSLTNGPAKLTQALGIISTELSGKTLGIKTLELTATTEPISKENIVVSTRIGIKEATEQPWRFYLKNNPFVSKPN
jgi:DNA-3-methyladenine glycosylase